MKLDLKITSVAFAFALLTACGGGGGGGGGGGPTGPTGPTVTELALPTYISPQQHSGTNAKSVSYTQRPAGVEAAPSLVQFQADQVKVASTEYPGFTKLEGRIGVDTNPNDNDNTADLYVQVYGLQYGDSSNRVNGVTPGNGSALLLFDSSGGVGRGGAELEGNLPTGNQTYRGYNFFRYTSAANDQQQSLQDGSFEFVVNFGSSTGTFTSNTSSSVGKSGTGGTTYAGTEMNAANVTVITSGNDAGNFKGDITITPSTTVGTTKTPGTALTAEMFGSFHGREGVGVSGQYHDKATVKKFQGAFAGDKNAPEPSSN